MPRYKIIMPVYFETVVEAKDAKEAYEKYVVQQQITVWEEEQVALPEFEDCTFIDADNPTVRAPSAPCPECKGTGRVTCHACHDKAPQLCVCCGGSGCEYCGDEGVLHCILCDKGKALCKTCLGGGM